LPEKLYVLLKMIALRKRILYIAVIITLLIVHCTGHSQKDIQSAEKKMNNSSPVMVSAVQTREFKAPVTTDPDTCPKPLIIRVPVVKGGSYIIRYATGPVTISLFPPEEKLLPVSREISTGAIIENPEAQGIGFFTTYTTDHGLALDGVTDGICDKSGYLWFCTAGGGVSRYDGKSFTNFTQSQGLANNSVWCVTQDKKGNLWFGTQGGISRYDGRNFTSYNSGNGLANNIVRSAATDRSGNIWFGTNGGGVSLYDGKTFTNYSVKDGLGYDYIYDMTEDNSGNMWFCTVGGGVSRFDGKAFKTFTSAQGLAGDVVVSACRDLSGNLWFGTYGGGVSRYDGKTFTTFGTVNGLGSNTVWRILCDKSGSLWFGTDGGGISRFDGSSFTNFTTSQGISNNSIWSIVEDRSENLWFGTLGGGVCRYNGKSFTNFTTIQGLANNVVRSIIEDNSGNIWFGTDLGGTSRYNGRSFTTFAISQGLINETVWSIGKDRHGNLWFGTAGGGVSKYDGKSFTTYSTEQGLANTIIRSIHEDRSGNMWFGSWMGGVSRFDGQSFTTYTTSQGLANNSVMDMAEDSTGGMWFCTYGGGISYFNGSTFSNFNSGEGLANNNVKCVTPDRRGNLWFGTEGGISIISSGKQKEIRENGEKVTGLFKNYTTKEGLPNNSVTEIMQSRKGVIYAGTNYGICEITTDDSGNLVTGNIYSSATGYPVKDVSSGFNTIYEDSKGIIWAGTGSDKTAVVRFDPRSIRHDTLAPEVVLQGIRINNENICWNYLRAASAPSSGDSLAILNEEYQTFGKELPGNELSMMQRRFEGITFTGITKFFPVPENLVLPHADNNVTFEFNALETGRHQMIRYRYMLEGYDKDWSPVTDKTTAAFGNIFEGSYTFRVKALSPDGVWSEPLIYRFRVLPPWYRTWLMYIIYLLVFLSVLYTVYRWRVARLRKENLILEEKVKLRTIELQQANREIEAQRDLVTKQKDHIEEIHKEVTDSIHYAKRLQTSAIPGLNELREHFSGMFILFKPKDVVSGDFYWYAKSGNKIIFTVADCTGHGVPGAFMSILGISLLKEIVIKEGLTQPDLILDLLRDEIIKALGQTGATGEQKDGMDISLCSVNTETLEMQWAGANLPCLIVRDGVMTEMKGDKMPIAIYEKMDRFALQEFKLQRNDIIYLSGDGYHDQFGGPQNKKFMSKRFKELLVSISGRPLEEQREILNETIEDWEKGYETKYEQTDDITVLGIKI
jgi:ligand-binding sensor domain-containing protein/serine phosphatase RsbU (regulator of sigma subunit)